MARNYEPWDLDDEIAGKLSSTMTAGTYKGLPDTTNVSEVQSAVGRERLTAELAGTTDKKSKAWRNIRDNLSRWRRGARKASARSVGRVRSAAQGIWRRRIGGSGSAHVELTATVVTSRTSWTGVMKADLTGADLTDYLAACGEGNWMQAAQIVADAYGLSPDLIVSIEDVHGFDLSGFTAPDEDE